MRPAWYFAWIPYVIPLDKNIVFHKVLSAIISAIIWAWIPCAIPLGVRTPRPLSRVITPRAFISGIHPGPEQACAKYLILISVFGHATAHYMNFAAAPYYSYVLGGDIYGRSPTVMAWDPKARGRPLSPRGPLPPVRRPSA